MIEIDHCQAEMNSRGFRQLAIAATEIAERYPTKDLIAMRNRLTGMMNKAVEEEERIEVIADPKGC